MPGYLLPYSKQVLQKSDTYCALLHPTKVSFMCGFVERRCKFESRLLGHLINRLEELVYCTPNMYSFKPFCQTFQPKTAYLDLTSNCALAATVSKDWCASTVVTTWHLNYLYVHTSSLSWHNILNTRVVKANRLDPCKQIWHKNQDSSSHFPTCSSWFSWLWLFHDFE